MRLRSTRLTAIANAIRDKFYGAALNMRFDNTTSLDSRVTFSRTTNATLTGSNGLIQNAPMNLLTFSEQFDNAAWSKLGSTVTANSTTAPDGTATADKLVEAVGNSQHALLRTETVSSAPVTYSVYAKSAERSWFLLYIGALNTSAYFDVANGVVGTVQSSVTASITSVGNGWYRCTITAASVGSGSLTRGIYLADADGNNTYTGNGTSGVFIWGAQLELGSTATTYNPTTVKNLLGYTENFDNAAWTKSNAFVQTNLLLQSEAFDTASWVKAPSDLTTFSGTGLQAVVTANFGAAPDGAATADRVQLNCNGGTTSSDRSGFNQAFTVTVGISYTASFYVKPLDSTTDNQILNSSLGTLAAGSSPISSTITDVGNGWKRVVRVYAPASSIATLRFQITGSTGPLTFDGLIWGAQLVQGTSAGDYKATYAAAAAVGYTDIYGQPFAQKLVETTANAQHAAFASVTLAAAPCTLSVYAKQAEGPQRWLNLFPQGTGVSASAIFDVTNGTVTATSGAQYLGSAITAVGNGWYRCSITFTAAAVSVANVVYLSNSSVNPAPGYTGDGTSGIYIFGAQLSDSASVDPYVYQPVAAPTSTAYYGPRFDYDPVTLAPKGLLIEEQRTNLCLQSEDFGTTWANTTSIDELNVAVSPSGTLTADKLYSTAGTDGFISQAVSIVSGTVYTSTVYAKDAGFSVFRIIQTAAGGDKSATFTLTGDGSAGLVSAGATATIDLVGNGWYRCSITYTATSTGATGFRIYPQQFGTTGDGTSGIYVWGAQLEAGAFATSYIPTVASQVTRAADSASMIGNNFARWYTQDTGTLYSDASQMGSAAATYRVFNFAGTNTPNISQFGNASNTGINGVFSIASSAYAVNVYSKTAFAYQISNFAMSKDGATATANTSATVLGTPTIVGIGQNGAGAQFLNGHIKRIAYYNRRLTNTELQAITS